jgi:hypothetical protein
MSRVACLFTRFAMPLQRQGRYKEAEFVQRLALRLEPNRYFTTLPLAATYHETGRHGDALPLFERGLAELKALQRNHEFVAAELSPAACLDSNAGIAALRKEYKTMYEGSLTAVAADRPRGAGHEPF